MSANILRPLIFGLFFASTASFAVDALPVVVVQPHAVDLTFPAESLVEAVQQATVGAQVAGRVLEVKVDAGKSVQKGDVLIWHPQLPHGGGQIADRTRTRNSIVMHTVPEGVPVYHAYAFFDPANSLPGQAAWPTERLHGRAYAAHETIEVMHQSPRSPRDFA